MHTCKNRPAIVKHPHDAAFGDPARRGVLRMQPQRFAALYLCATADRTLIVLTVQPRTGLAGKQMQRPARADLLLCLCLRFVPERMSRTFFIIKVGHGLREQLNFAGRRGQRRTHRVITERFKEDLRRIRSRIFQLALLPEIIKIRQFDAVGLRPRSRNLIDMAQPGHRIAPFTERLAKTQLLRQPAENRKVALRLIHRRNMLTHRNHKTVIAGTANVIALK